jgi:sarcosine oxidase subunit alpha
VGLVPVEATDPVVAGSHLFTEGAVRNTGTDQGWITSACYSPHVGSAIGLGFLAEGEARQGEIIIAANPLEGQAIRLRVVSPHFVDPEGGRLRV